MAPHLIEQIQRTAPLLPQIRAKKDRIVRDGIFWDIFRSANAAGIERLEFLRNLIGFKPAGDATTSAGAHILQYHRFVIPNGTRWECHQCGVCCASIEGANGAPEPCQYLRADGRCNTYEDRWIPCRQFPFATLNMPPWGAFLLISEVCIGTGTGPTITPQQYNRLLVTHRRYADELLKKTQAGTAPRIKLCFHYDPARERWQFSNPKPNLDTEAAHDGGDGGNGRTGR